MERSSPSTFFAAEEEKEAPYHTPETEGHGQHKLVLVEGLEAKFSVEHKFTSWKTVEVRKGQWTKADTKEMERGLHKLFFAAGPQIKDKKASWQKSLKESQKREDELVRQTRLATNREDKEESANLKITSTPGVRCCGEADVVFGAKKASPKKSSNALKGTRTSWNPAEKKTEETPWQLSQSSNTKSQNLESFYELGQRQRLGQRQGRYGKPLGIKQKRIWGKSRPQVSPNKSTLFQPIGVIGPKKTLVQDLRRAGKLFI